MSPFLPSPTEPTFTQHITSATPSQSFSFGRHPPSRTPIRFVRARSGRWTSPLIDQSKFGQTLRSPTNHPRRCRSEPNPLPTPAHRSNKSSPTASPCETVPDSSSNLDQTPSSKRAIRSNERSASQNDQCERPTAHQSRPNILNEESDRIERTILQPGQSTRATDHAPIATNTYPNERPS